MMGVVKQMIVDREVELFELQHWLNKAEKILKSITKDSNPVYLEGKVTDYFNQKEEAYE